MNIFVLDKDPELAAMYHCDRHCVKLLLEMSQILSTAHHILDGELSPAPTKSKPFRKIPVKQVDDTALYKSTHENHPSTIWARETSENYIWASKLLLNLCDVYTARYGRVHKSQSSGLVSWLSLNIPRNIKKSGPTPFALAMPDYIKNQSSCAVDAYRRYYVLEKTRMLNWKLPHSEPYWVKEYKNV